ncbi:hypothetical protein GCM10027577_06380 [Spirosoma fluminis]
MIQRNDACTVSLRPRSGFANQQAGSGNRFFGDAVTHHDSHAQPLLGPDRRRTNEKQEDTGKKTPKDHTVG